jgi:hypothetical protein
MVPEYLVTFQVIKKTPFFYGKKSSGSEFLTQTSIFLTIVLVSGAIRLYVTLGLMLATLHFSHTLFIFLD